MICLINGKEVPYIHRKYILLGVFVLIFIEETRSSIEIGLYLVDSIEFLSSSAKLKWKSLVNCHFSER